MSVNIAIIGAGIGGITAAITLQNKLGLYDYTIYELAPDIGGTWRQNTYPGCACDVPGHWYSLSSEPNPDWSRSFAPREEIYQYWKGLVNKHSIEPHIKFNTEFVSAAWNEKDKSYTMRLRDVKTHQVKEVRAKIVISAVGYFNHPRWPDVPGRETFEGDLLHAQMWDHSVPLSGKRVALIGNGCSGAQILPVISEDSSTKVTNFCRTPSWFVPRYMTEYIKSVAPAQYHQYLIPNYEVGCKRVVWDPGYLKSLHRPNVEMEWDPIAKILPDGIETVSGHKHQFDVIAFATGFDIAQSLVFDLTGTNGQRLQEYYDREGGPTGYLGTTIPGRDLVASETDIFHRPFIGYFCRGAPDGLHYPASSTNFGGDVKGLMPRADSTRAWNKWAQRKNGKNFTIWPGGNLHMWWSLRKPDWKDFEVIGDNSWLLKRRILDIISSVAQVGVLSASIAALVLAKTGNWDAFAKAIQGRLGDDLDWCRRLVAV
ncbi:L-lysine 6-monooxygenase (NADPH-requiring) [Rhizoctonia solani]|uniref:L-lysine 6-monooxygenase (NADPH-requiring) n=1 Tax=Rhizoctonia solani TaxID=456999 RepID=A0A8H7M891_9AGAM|nr:L-lysine 6-monooxygenase (NADPH-requiring) [Rhizoctonia solani]